jgi:hypothetical protein
LRREYFAQLSAAALLLVEGDSERLLVDQTFVEQQPPQAPQARSVGSRREFGAEDLVYLLRPSRP